MPLYDIYRAVRAHTRDQSNSLKANTQGLGWRLTEVFARTWDLGFTSFGGPPVHFKILHQRFVEGVGGKNKWLDEQTYQEIFAISQALPGPGSTKMLFSIAQLHAGIVPAIFVFLLWSLPGAIVMYGLSLGVQKIATNLPPIVYALLSGMNASTVGIIALAAVQLAEKAIKDKMTRLLVIFGACAGLCYNSLWYFPVLIVIGGLTTLVWDIWLQRKIGKIRAKLRRRNKKKQRSTEEETQIESIALEEPQHRDNTRSTQRRAAIPNPKDRDSIELAGSSKVVESPRDTKAESEDATTIADTTTHGIPVKLGLIVIAVFFATFIAVMVLRGTLANSPLAFDLFANMYLAGTIIFGGGPVVIPLLRSYVVDPGWVSPRDFLLGLAIIQALPGPNFNFGIYLSALALAPTNIPTFVGALIGFAIFVPGLILTVGIQSLWRVARTKAWVISLLRGINCTAVGLVFTAVYRLWEIGYLTPQTSSGISLANEPFWVVVAALTYAESAWFGVPPALSIVIGAVLGLGWFGAVGR